MDYHRASRMDRWSILATVNSVTNFQYFKKFSICYVNAIASTPVFTYSPVSIAVGTEFVTKILA
jgi:hypothetical protein